LFVWGNSGNEDKAEVDCMYVLGTWFTGIKPIHNKNRHLNNETASLLYELLYIRTKHGSEYISEI